MFLFNEAVQVKLYSQEQEVFENIFDILITVNDLHSFHLAFLRLAIKANTMSSSFLGTPYGDGLHSKFLF